MIVMASYPKQSKLQICKPKLQDFYIQIAWILPKEETFTPERNIFLQIQMCILFKADQKL